MSEKINNFFEELKTKRVAVIGMGVSHFDMVKLFVNKGVKVTVCDKRDAEYLGESYDVLSKMGVKFCFGEQYLNDICDYDVVFRTPGMYYNNPILKNARKNGVVVTSEMEVFFDLCPCKTYAVTGSDGKTTTTTLIAEMLKASGKTVHLGGNIGKALLPIIDEIKSDDVAVVELSSFQLISMRCAPDVSVITNVSPNHLDVHGTMEEYTSAKTNIFMHQNAFSKTVLNLDNEITNGFSDDVRGKLMHFSKNDKVFNGTYLDDKGDIYRVKNGVDTKIMNKDSIKLPGMHNVENYLTAICAVFDEVSDDTIINIAKTFGGVEHRIEFVRELDGVKYYNDSIATSPTRTIAGLNSFEQKLIVIAGGYDKKIPYEPLAKPVNEHVKILILLGATAPKIEKAVKEYEGYNPDNIRIINVDTLEQAVKEARELASAGDVVTLSPASASFDLYRNFEQRGIHFKNIVKSL